MLATAGAIGWTAILLVSFVGWGSAMRRLVSPRCAISIAECGAWGLAACAILGGVIDLAGVGTRPVLLAVVAVGAGMAVPTLLKLRIPTVVRRTPFLFVAIAIAIAVITLGSANSGIQRGAPAATNFNAHDDFYAYLVFPERLKQSGRIGDDPFSERRLVSGLGAQSFLDGLMIAAIDRRHLHLLDPALGLLLAVGIAVALAQRRGLSPHEAAGAALLVLSVAPPAGNLTALTTGLTTLLALGAIATLPEDCMAPGRRVVLTSLLGAAAAALKSTLLAPAAIAVLCSLRRWRDVPVVAGVVVAALSPWMLSLYRSSGTLLYPVLGQGTHGSVPDPPASFTVGALVRMSVTTWFHVPAAIGLMVLAGAVAWAARRHMRKLSASLCLVPAAVGGMSVILVFTAGLNVVHRFMYPIILAAAVAACIEVWSASRRAGYVALAGAALMASDPAWRTRIRYQDFLLHINATQLEDETGRYWALQHAVPPGAVILTRLERPYLMDFSRNVIYCSDFPAGASPKPGMPTGAGPEAVAMYLRQVGVRFIAYDYATQAGFDQAKIGYRLAAGVHPWVRDQARYSFAFQNDLSSLRAMYPAIYDDGRAFVLDLGKQKGGP